MPISPLDKTSEVQVILINLKYSYGVHVYQ